MALTDKNNILIINLHHNDLDSFNALYYQYHQVVFRNICKLIHKYEVAEDILQEVFLALWEHRLTLDPDKSVAGWLFVVSYNKAMSWLKKDIREAKEIKIAVEMIVEHEEQQSSENLFSEQLKAINDIVEKLPPRNKQAFRLCKLEGRTYEEAGSILGISTDTVKEYVKTSNRLIRQQVVCANDSFLMTGVTTITLFLGA